MITAQEMMTCEILTLAPETTVEEAIMLMVQNHVSGLPVLDGAGRLVGIVAEVTLFDVLFDARLRHAPVADFMTTKVETVAPEDSIEQVARKLALHGIRRLPVMAEGNLVGIVTRRDVLRHCLKAEAAPGLPVDQLADFVRLVSE